MSLGVYLVTWHYFYRYPTLCLIIYTQNLYNFVEEFLFYNVCNKEFKCYEPQ